MWIQVQMDRQDIKKTKYLYKYYTDTTETPNPRSNEQWNFKLNLNLMWIELQQRIRLQVFSVSRGDCPPTSQHHTEKKIVWGQKKIDIKIDPHQDSGGLQGGP